MPRKSYPLFQKKDRIHKPESPENAPSISPILERITDNGSKAWDEKQKNSRIETEQTIEAMLDGQLEISTILYGLGWDTMIRRHGAYYPKLIKEFYTIMTQKTNKNKISITTTAKGVRIHFDRVLISEIAHIPNVGPSITFDYISRNLWG